jgi:gamma-glutamyl:cysteine ligase YbdK (ATP-grasp superfamily)
MGLEIERDRFEERDYERCTRRLDECLEALRAVIARPGFGAGPPTIGSELELHLVDEHALAKPINGVVLAELAGRSSSHITFELARFNLEINTAPLPLAGRPFTAMRAQLDEALHDVRSAAAMHGARVATIGVLPTLRERDLDPSVLTESRRYRALSESIRRLRHGPSRVRIEGIDALDMVIDDVTLEGATAAFQVHLKVPPERFAAHYNAAQIVAAPVLACSANSPLFLRRRLWDETRIGLFRQAIDERCDDWRPARVTFGHAWVRHGAVELFEEAVGMHEPLLPIVGAVDPRDAARAGRVPQLPELRLHQGTTWWWNRAVYDDADGGHLRIEMRALPSGPTVVDMVASAAFEIGATIGLAARIEELLARMTFSHARQNFYDAARFGIDAVLLWPAATAPSPRPARARNVVSELLSVARAGLVASDVDAAEADTWLDVVARRAARRSTGAAWQRATFDALARTRTADDAAATMLERYVALSESGESVADWPPVRP